jgi:hypothetical protein
MRPPRQRDGATHVYHLYVTRSVNRDRWQALLKARGVGSGVHYPCPVHLQPAYAARVALGPGGCPETERAAREVLSLPVYPELTDADVMTVCAALEALLRDH